MKKVVYLPLDERPCNARFPYMLFDTDLVKVVMPEVFGDKKTPADTEALSAFLLRECADAEGLIISIDMLLYGGLIPSRIHNEEKEEILERFKILKKIKSENSNIKIYAFQCIMRCPTYSSSDEEPEYYAVYGEQIHALGVLKHRLQLGEIEVSEKIETLEQEIEPKALEDYLSRRAKNLFLNLAMLEFVEDGTVDFLVIPQDDAAPLGFTAMDQEKVRKEIRKKKLQQKVFVYPGADEVGITLFSRMYNFLEKRCPGVYVKYASSGASTVIPPFEDRPLGETVHYQIVAAGCHLTNSPELADFILAITAPSDNIIGSAAQPRMNLDYDVYRSLSPFFEELCYWMDQEKPVSICDNAYTNGGDLELLSMLDASERMFRVAGFAAWNTSSNTMGTAIGEAVRYLYKGRDECMMNFLALRYLEDCGYDSVVRQSVTTEDLPELGFDYFDVSEREGEAARRVKSRLQAFINESMKSEADHIQIERVALPWKRMFEVDLDVHYV